MNGVTVTEPDTWVDLERDHVALDAKPIENVTPVYLVLYKPRGYLTTYRHPKGRATVYDLVKGAGRYLVPVGRLDLETSGLLLMTNDTAFVERIANPAHEVPKTYLVKTTSRLDDDQLDRLRRGIDLDDGTTRPAEVNRLRDTASGRTFVEITICEGRNRQVRRMVEALGSHVMKLVRVAIGPIRIGDLPIGSWRALTIEELASLGWSSGSTTPRGRGRGPDGRKRTSRRGTVHNGESPTSR